jgi:FMN phosphatase YigB (HAD superfamily)
MARPRFGALLLDLNGTFMFGGDRFGPEQDYFATYRALGGGVLDAPAVRRAVDGCFAALAARYEDPRYFDDFPSVSEVLADVAGALPAEERGRIEAVIADHELGGVPDAYADAVRRLAATHRLGLVCNLWSRADRWVAELERAGVLHLFGAVVFSSEGRSIKPSPRPFEEAVTALGVPRSAVAVVGDSLRCDVGGAAAAGLASVWIAPPGTPLLPGSPTPGWTVRDLRDL